MAASETNLPATRPTADGPPNASSMNNNRHGSNFNTFQFVSQLVSATPPYLLNMSSPFPGNFFSDLLRRMAPRAGTPGLSLDATLQQHIRAALLTKSTSPPGLPSVMHQSLDLAALAAQHRQPQVPPPPQEKGVKRSLFTDVASLTGRDEENAQKRPRLEESRDERRKPISDSGNPSFLLQPPFLQSSVPPPPDVVPSWPTSVSLIRPQMPIPAHVHHPPLDPYRFLLDLRLAGQLRTMAAFHHHKDQHPNPLIAPTAVNSRPIPSKETKNKEEELTPSISVSQNGPLRGDSRVSAFHPPGRLPEDEENGEHRSCSSNSNTSSNSSRDSVGPQYIFRHLNDIYRTIDHQKPEDVDEAEAPEKEKSTNQNTEDLDEKPKTESTPFADISHCVRPSFPLVNGQSEGPSFKANITIKNSES